MIGRIIGRIGSIQSDDYLTWVLDCRCDARHQRLGCGCRFSARHGTCNARHGTCNARHGT